MSAPNNDNTLRPASRKSLSGDSETTVARSVEPSVLDTKDAMDSTMVSAAPSMREKSADPELVPVTVPEAAKENEAVVPAGSSDDDDEENFEYPKAWKLGIITLALCLSVFCMALYVGPFLHPIGSIV